MSDASHRNRHLDETPTTAPGKKAEADAGSRFPVQLKRADLATQERALAPGAQAGFAEQEAALKPVQRKAGAKKEESAPALAGKKPKFKVIPGKADVHRMSAGAAGKLEVANVTLPFKFSSPGIETVDESAYSDGPFDKETLTAAALESLGRIVTYDMTLQDLTEDDLRPHAERLATVMLRAAK